MWLLSNLVCSTQKKVWPTGFVICLQTSLSRAPPCLAKPKEKNRAVNPAVAVFFALKLAFHALSSANPFDVANKKRVWVWMRMFLCAAPQKKNNFCTAKKEKWGRRLCQENGRHCRYSRFLYLPTKRRLYFLCYLLLFLLKRRSDLRTFLLMVHTRLLCGTDKTRNVRYYKCTK